MTVPTSGESGLPGARFLDPNVLSHIGNLELLARVVVEGFIGGLHRAPHLGASTDFAQHKLYMPGDDIRRIDWKLWARTDRYFIKEYEADTNTNFMVILDVSRSMRYGMSTDAARVSKLEYGAYLSACLAYFSSLQRDRIGLSTIDGDVVDYVPSSAKHLQNILHTLDRTLNKGRDDAAADATAPVVPGSASKLAPPMRKLADLFRRKSMIVVISDFYEEPDDIIEAMTYLRGRGNDIIAFHLLDTTELEFPFVDATNFIDLETGEKLPVIPEYLRKQYREVVQEHIGTVGRRLADHRVDYAFFDTSKPLDRALFTYLSTRERLGRVR